MPDLPLFASFFLGGFECSTHRARSGKRLDMIAATGHDTYVRHDYALLRERGIRSVREGLRWHLIERAPGAYDFSSVLPLVRAANDLEMQVIWDLCHYGWPDDLDLLSPSFAGRFAGLAQAFARLLKAETDAVPFVVPINEISFFSWSAGAVGYFYPFLRDRGEEVKRQLVRAAIAGIEATWSVSPHARILHVEPATNPVHDPARPEQREAAEWERSLQFHAWDMLAGRMAPELGGKSAYLDILGVNYYPHNQWIFDPSWERRVPIFAGHPQYRLFRHLLADVHERYGRPLFVSETGNEDERRTEWLAYIGEEVRAARAAGVPAEGICWYPIVNHPGWDDGRHCNNGLWDYADAAGRREPCAPLVDELERQQLLISPSSVPLRHETAAAS